MIIMLSSFIIMFYLLVGVVDKSFLYNSDNTASKVSIIFILFVISILFSILCSDILDLEEKPIPEIMSYRIKTLNIVDTDYNGRLYIYTEESKNNKYIMKAVKSTSATIILIQNNDNRIIYQYYPFKMGVFCIYLPYTERLFYVNRKIIVVP